MLAGMMIPAVAAGSAPTFEDVPTTDWAYAYIEEMVAKGVMEGVGNNKFNPGGSISTAEFATMMDRAFWPGVLNSETPDAECFENPNAWWVKYIWTASRVGILSGTTAAKETINHPSSDRGFYVDQWGDFVTDPMNRYDMAMMIYRAMYCKNLQGANVTMPSDSEQNTAQNKIADWNTIPSNYQTAVKVAYSAGILTGTDNIGTFAGSNTMTRAEASTVMSRLLAYGIEPDDPNASDINSGNTTPAPTPTPTPTPGNSNSNTETTTGTGKSDEYPTTGGASYFADSTFGMAIKASDEADYNNVIAAAQTANKNGYYTGANVDIGNATLQYDLLALVNNARKAEGLNEVTWTPSDAVEELTLLRAHELTTNYAHTTREIGNYENIASGQTNVQKVFNAWMNSSGHYRTIMDTENVYMCAARENNCWIIMFTTDDDFDIPRIEYFAINNYATT